MIFGSLVDSVLIFGSNRKSYVYIGALLITMSSLMMIAVVGEYSIVAEFSKKSVYIFASVIAVVGFVMQDVTHNHNKQCKSQATKQHMFIELRYWHRVKAYQAHPKN
jgi:hypothetical protein